MGGRRLWPSPPLRTLTDPLHCGPHVSIPASPAEPATALLVCSSGPGGLRWEGQELCWWSEPPWPFSPAPWPFPQIITSEEAERRGQIYDRQGATYLFDLDYVEDVYTVDAAYYGNISHFVNHSVGTPQAGGGREEQAGAPPHPPAVLFRLV